MNSFIAIKAVGSMNETLGQNGFISKFYQTTNKNNIYMTHCFSESQKRTFALPDVMST